MIVTQRAMARARRNVLQPIGLFLDLLDQPIDAPDVGFRYRPTALEQYG
jgi:hypothetical protein